ncbi:MAG: hypothetical protein A2487_01530 [Candidatus Raymondbacteria bacterium RifOxyC12_full_50_8]|nr:MAG: hypothetical protein A2487_01530 [Candidatus Raymondbacteria bacterium RifOxyC12_full_50_8]
MLKSFRPSPSGNRYFRKKDITAFLARENPLAIGSLAGKARDWVLGATPAPLPSTLHCETSDIFNARLTLFGHEIGSLPYLKDIFPLVVAIAGEIGNNSYNHNLGNWPDMPGAFFGYNLSEGLVMLADRGQGVYATLKRVLPDLKDDKDALYVAFTQHVSGRAPENRGNGLKFVKDVVLANPLSLQFASGSAELILNRVPGKMENIEAGVPVHGCLARIVFPRKGINP